MKDTSKMPPAELADYRLELAGEYAWCAAQLEQILTQKPKDWIELRKECKSDAATDKRWERTEQGINEIGLRWRMKATEKVMSAIKTKIDILSNEARNQM